MEVEVLVSQDKSLTLGCCKVCVCPTSGENGFLKITLSHFPYFSDRCLAILEDPIVALLPSIPHNKPLG